VLQDLRFSLRAFRRQWGFVLTATLTLALGVGATTAIFTAVDAVLFNQLPFPDATDLYRFRSEVVDGRTGDGSVSRAEVTRLETSLPAIVQAAAGSYDYEGLLVDSSGNPVKAHVQAVIGSFFDVFGVPMALGRNFLDEEFAGGAPAIIISYRAWNSWFGGDPAILDRSVSLEGAMWPVVGVAAEGFGFPRGTDAWVAFPGNPNAPGHFVTGYLRTRPGVSADRLGAALGPLSTSLQQEFVNANAGRVLSITPLLDDVVGPIGLTLLIVLAAAGLLLAVACVNVTSLLLARGVVRAREVALRLALGATRWRIFRQLLTESVVLASVGCLAGVALAAGLLSVVLSAGAAELPRIDEVQLDIGVLYFALATTVLTGLVVGVVPAIRLVRTDLRSLVNEGGRAGTTGAATHRLLNGMVIAEIVLAVAVVAGGALLVRSFSNLQNTDPGFSADGRIVFEVTLPVFTYDDYDRVADWMGTLLARIGELPGVTDVGAVSSAPFATEFDGIGPFWPTSAGVPPVDERWTARRRAVSPDFFRTADIRLLGGRQFQPTDRRDTPGVVIVDETLAQKFYPGGDALGQQIRIRQDPNPGNGSPLNLMRPAEAEIVGIVEPVRFASVGLPPEPTYYYPLEQLTNRRQIVVVATDLEEPSGLIESVRRIVCEADPMLPVEYYDMGQLMYRALTRERLSVTLLTFFGGAALLLAAIGIYGIMSYTVAQRTPEFAIRAALGAQPSSILSLVLTRGGVLAGTGVLLGLGAVVLGGRVLESQLYGLAATDPLVLAGVALSMALIVGSCTLIPAWRASRVTAASIQRD